MKLGIIGTGRIANRFVPEARTITDICIDAVYNPRECSAQAFAEKWNILCATDDFTKFCSLVDAVYIASPHETHYEYAKSLLLAGKHVLCEKPLCFSKEEAEELFGIAKEKSVVLMEAVKTAYCPGFKELIKVAKNGIIGEIKDIEACFTKLEDPNGRELNSEKYAGSFYELGTYTLLPIVKLLGEPKEIYIQSIDVGERKVDGFAKVHLIYDEAFALAKTGLTVKSEGCLIISGTKGYIWVPSPWWLTRTFDVRFEDARKTQVYEFPFEGQGLRYEIQAFWEYVMSKPCCIRDECALTVKESILLAGIMERVRKFRK